MELDNSFSWAVAFCVIQYLAASLASIRRCQQLLPPSPPLPQPMITENASRHHQMFPGGHNCPFLRTTDLEKNILHKTEASIIINYQKGCTYKAVEISSGRCIYTSRLNLSFPHTTWKVNCLNRKIINHSAPSRPDRVLGGLPCRGVFMLQVLDRGLSRTPARSFIRAS